MQIRLFFFGVLIVLGASLSELKAQYSDKQFSLSVNLNYTTTAKLYLNPRSSDEIIRNDFVPLEQIVSPSVDIRYNLTEDLIIGLSTEILKKTAVEPDLMAASSRGTVAINVEDGFKLVPVELSAYYLLPFSSDNFRLYMGGGVAYYYGEHIRKVSDIEVSNLSREFAYGIQFSVSSDYMLNKYLSLRGEMKFRDPEFEVTSVYNKQSFLYQGQTVYITQKSFISKTNVDGITFALGLAFHF